MGRKESSWKGLFSHYTTSDLEWGWLCLTPPCWQQGELRWDVWDSTWQVEVQLCACICHDTHVGGVCGEQTHSTSWHKTSAPSVETPGQEWDGKLRRNDVMSQEFVGRLGIVVCFMRARPINHSNRVFPHMIPPSLVKKTGVLTDPDFWGKLSNLRDSSLDAHFWSIFRISLGLQGSKVHLMPGDSLVASTVAL